MKVSTQILFPDSYASEKLLITNSLSNPLRIRPADGSMSMARHGVHIEFHIGTLKISKEFIVILLSRQYQIISGFEFLKGVNLRIDWTAGTLRISDNENN